MTTRRWIAIEDEISLRHFLQEVDHFHDAAIREIAMVAREYVTPDLSFEHYGQPADGVVVVHSQNPHAPVIELRCRGIRRIAWDVACELEGAGEVTASGVTLRLAQSPTPGVLIAADEIAYRIGGTEDVGPSLRVVKPGLLAWLDERDGGV